jgi:hypothetical protein
MPRDLERLRRRTAASIAESLGTLSARWMRRSFGPRRRAVRRLFRDSVYGVLTAEAMLDDLFGELTAPRLKALLASELPDPRVLDGFRPDGRGRRVRAFGPQRIYHVFSANVPHPAVLSLALGLLVKSENVGKPSSRDRGFVDEYLASLKRHDPVLGACARLAPSRGSDPALAAADLVVAYGRPETLAAIRARLRPEQAFFGYGHRVSFGLVTREALAVDAGALARRFARDVWSADQRGCLSPAAVFVESGGRMRPERFAELLAEALEAMCRRDPLPAGVAFERALAVGPALERSRLRAVRGGRSRAWVGRPRGSWAVLYDEEAGEFPLACGLRTLRVKAVRDASAALSAARPFGRYLQCAALEAGPWRRRRLAEALAAAGVNRVCRAGRMQRPPLRWHHDGRFNIASWLRWCDLEEGR